MIAAFVLGAFWAAAACIAWRESNPEFLYVISGFAALTAVAAAARFSPFYNHTAIAALAYAALLFSNGVFVQRRRRG